MYIRGRDVVFGYYVVIRYVYRPDECIQGARFFATGAGGGIIASAEGTSVVWGSGGCSQTLFSTPAMRYVFEQIDL